MSWAHPLAVLRFECAKLEAVVKLQSGLLGDQQSGDCARHEPFICHGGPYVGRYVSSDQGIETQQLEYSLAKAILFLQIVLAEFSFCL